MRSRYPYHVAVAMTAAVALSFAAAVESASGNAVAAAERANAEALMADLLKTPPLENFRNDDQNE